jgi:hypothetical protein
MKYEVYYPSCTTKDASDGVDIFLLFKNVSKIVLVGYFSFIENSFVRDLYSPSHLHSTLYGSNCKLILDLLSLLTYLDNYLHSKRK